MFNALARVGATIALVSAAVLSAGPAHAATPIGPNQYFAGNVNGKTSNASIMVGCFGPIATGHPLPSQYVLVTPAPSSTTTNIGYTGTSANAVTVTLLLGTSSGGIGSYPVGTLTKYDTKLAIPTTLTLPCAASGRVVFTPTPTSSTARPATVTVTVVGQP